MDAAINDLVVIKIFDSNGIGMARTISISKIIKIMPSKKNRRENGIRALFLGSKPHSNGEVFSRSLNVRIFKNHAAAEVIDLRTVANIMDSSIKFMLLEINYIFSSD